MLNLNKDSLFISNFDNGTTQNIECRLGRCLYYIDLSKNSNDTTLYFYRKIAKQRNRFSKYSKEAGCISVTLRNDALLDRNFFENIREIARAQEIVSKYNQKLYVR